MENKNIKFEKTREVIEPYEDAIHDIKTALSIIYSVNQLMDLNTTIPEDVRRQLNVIKRNCLRAIKIVNDVSDTAKLDSSHLKPNYAAFNIVSVVGSLAECAEIYSMPKGIRISFAYDLKQEIISLDRLMLERILLNLISNSIKFTGDGGLIKLFLSQDDKNIRITLSDNGNGISNDCMKNIFKRYSTTDNQSGRGIGLSIVKQLVSIMKGKIYIESIQGRGTSTTIEFPLKPAHKGKSHDKILQDDFYVDNMVKIELAE